MEKSRILNRYQPLAGRFGFGFLKPRSRVEFLTERRAPSFRRRAQRLVLAASVGLLLELPQVVLAMTPAFSVDVDATTRALAVTVRFDSVPSGFAWGQLEASGVLDELVGVLPSSDVDEHGRPLKNADAILIHLARVSAGVYRGETALPHGGMWAVVAWPLVKGFDPATPTQVVSVREGRPVAIWVGAAMLFAATLLAFVRTMTHPTENQNRTE